MYSLALELGRPQTMRQGMPVFLPVLMLPAVAFSLWVWLAPDASHQGAGSWAFAAAGAGLGLYALSCVLSLGELWQAIRARRVLRHLQGDLAAEVVPVWVADASGTVLFQNAAAHDFAAELIGRPVALALGRIAADPGAQATMMLRRARLDGTARQKIDRHLLSVSLKAAGALQIWRLSGAEVLPPPAETGSVPTPALVVPDFDLLPVALVKLSPDGRVLHANRAACAILGQVERDTHLTALVDGLGRPIDDWVSDVVTGRAEGRPEVLRIRAAQDASFVQVTLTRCAAEAGRGEAGLVAVLSDATAMKTLEAQFVQSQKMQAIGQLAGGIAHDFNNLLTAITGHCDLLMLRHDKGDPEYADLDQISQNANRAASLVGQLLAFSRKQTLKPQILDLRDSLSDLTHLLNRLVGERISLVFHHDPALRPIRADKRQLEQVVMNLVVNARDAMPSGGDITISTENIRFSEAQARDRVSLPKGDYVRVVVRDEGCGIEPDKLNKIFEPFYTTKRTGEGTGLGLSTAYGIVKQTGGYIFCDSEPGVGTAFSLYFPAHDLRELEALNDNVPAAAAASVPPLSERQGTVLLVEDEAPVRAFASRALKLHGFEVLEADSAEAALDLLQDQKLQIDVFVTDVVMPGMDGPSWVRSALRERPDTRVVFVSGYTEDIFNDGRAPVPNSVFLPKPFTLTELTAFVQKQFESGS